MTEYRDEEVFTLTVNGIPRTVSTMAASTLLDVLRDELRLTGTKKCCETGDCGACTVLLGGMPVTSCLVLAAEVDGGEQVITVEGLHDDPRFGSLVQAFASQGAIQCGYCTPGILVSCWAFLRDAQRVSIDDIVDALAGNLCRCTGYRRIIQAVIDTSRCTDHA